jgi:hypothetical protein
VARTANPSWEIVGVPDGLVTEFSTRGKAIEMGVSDGLCGGLVL